jgi:hypothetical protein
VFRAPGSGTTITGPPGPTGADGNTILNGSGAPDNGNGANGDYYFDTATSDWYGPKAAGVWGSRFSKRITCSATEPTGPANGDIWVDIS